MRAGVGVGLVGLGVLVAASVPIVACGTFGETDPPVDGGAGAATTDGGADGADGASSADGAIQPNPADCVDLTAGAADYQPVVAGTGATASNDAGLSIMLPASTTEIVAAWRRTFSAPTGATGAAVLIDATIDLPRAALPTSPDWYAEFAGLLNGDEASAGVSSLVLISVSNDSQLQASFDLDLFPTSTAANASASAAFAKLSPGPHRVTTRFDVKWSTQDAPNVRAQLDNGSFTEVSGKTLSGAGATQWSLSLGGAAQNHPNLSIVYRRVCITAR